MNAANVIALSASRAVSYGKNASPAALNPVHVRFGAFELDEVNGRLLRDGAALTLAPRPFGLLCALARRPGALLTKHTLLDSVWGHQFVSESVLKTAVSEVRTVLDDHPRQPRFIETVSRRGYRFIASTMTIPSTTAIPGEAPVWAIDFQEHDREMNCALSRPVFATMEEVRYAHELRLQLRSHFLRHAVQQTGRNMI